MPCVLRTYKKTMIFFVCCPSCPHASPRGVVLLSSINKHRPKCPAVFWAPKFAKMMLTLGRCSLGEHAFGMRHSVVHCGFWRTAKAFEVGRFFTAPETTQSHTFRILQTTLVQADAALVFLGLPSSVPCGSWIFSGCIGLVAVTR